jgi:hypothetical protein
MQKIDLNTNFWSKNFAKTFSRIYFGLFDDLIIRKAFFLELEYFKTL